MSSPRAAFAVSALLAANLAVVGTRAVHAGNLAEYSASFWSAFGILALAACVLTGGIWGGLLAIPRRWRGRPVVGVFTLALLAWVQGNWLLGDYGLLDGGGLDMRAAALDRNRDLALWLGGLALAQLGYRFLQRHVARIAGIFLLLQLLALPLAGLLEGDGASDSSALVASPEIFSLSRERNLLLVVLDTVTSDSFVHLAAADPGRFDRDFAGFVVYGDAVGAFPSTQYSLPVMLGAPPYDNRVPIADYMAAALQHDAITLPLLAHGYRVDWVSAWPLFCQQGRYSDCYAIPRPYAPPPQYRLHMAAELFDLSLFRHAPYPLKKWVYADGDWRVQSSLFGPGDPPVFVSSAARFYDDFNAALVVDRDEPTFKIVHTGGGHGPYVLDSACNLVPKRPYAEPSYRQQLQCSLEQTAELLRRLRELGVYDAATIVVAGDHGASFGSAGLGSHGLTPNRLSRSRPLLAVKWPGATGGLRVSPAPASIADIAPTLAAAAGIPGEFPGVDLATLAPDAPRRRDYGLYALRRGTPGGHLERVERYSVAPQSRRPAAWRFEGAAFSPAISLSGTRIDAGAPAATRHFSLLGWGAPAKTAGGVAYRPARGPVATVFAALPAGRVELRARLRVEPRLLPQVVAIEIAGRRVGQWRIAERGFHEYALALPDEPEEAPPTAVSFQAQRYQSPGGGARGSAFDLEWIDFATAPAD